MKWIDLRSDTVTLPTPAMRRRMAEAVVGDDVYGEDETVNRLEEMAAKRLGKQAGLFVPSGTMGNLIAILVHCGRGQEVILGDLAHTYLYEAGGTAAVGGVHPFTVPNQPDGTICLADIEAAIRSENDHFPRTSLVMLENTHNRCGGVPLCVDYTKSVAKLARSHNLKLHIDGARIFNAAVALDVAVAELTRPADSITFCLSKGLSAPVGSVLCGSRRFIAEARRMRKLLGGGMRQAGIIAAAGIEALETMVARLADDHARARKLADVLHAIEGVRLDSVPPPSNMIFLNLAENHTLDAAALCKKAARANIKLVPSGARRIRLVLHHGIDDEGLQRAEDFFRETIS